jgi:hypothetical protein
MLVVCIFASALGALVMCLLVLRDGFSPISPDPARADRDVLVTRLGHAVAGACFATTAILATVLVARTPAPWVVTAADPRVSERMAALDRERQALGEQVSALGATVQELREQVGIVGGSVQGVRARLDEAEGRVTRAESGLKRLGDDVAQASLRARQVERPVAARPAAAPVREVPVQPAARTLRRGPAEGERALESASRAPREAVLPGPVTQAGSVGPVAPEDVPRTSLGDKMRNDWDTIRRGFASAGDDIASAMRNVGRRVSGRD